ncbi:hypothetical protein BCR33DRAFT_712440 [Rhizoclosmatium globosum]|uniref:Uncharacterized protein n=1 Tax=Rhizoclosmatium globosum TaxID=329046 RepID=A0A1Y2CWF3_9FUNG|nr:hypothetical protein BCR33DRAFT_712440 [Rhizoclosmatium globosum]|eukprot:ORY51362.1 hypothetical protein BCR33DRAFT_712440 [Rhizoclosmatium globosum]
MSAKSGGSPSKRASIATRASLDAVRASVALVKGLEKKSTLPALPSSDVLGAPVGVNESKQSAKDVSEKDYQEIAVMALANEFFKTNDISLELRTYMLENIIPTMMMALEKLLREVDVRGMANSDDFIEAINETNEEASGSQDDLKPTAITKDDDTTQSSKDRLEIQIDKPTKIPFNPINWIAQYLYRNNPRYVDPTDISNVPYFQQLRTVSQQTKARLFEFQLTQRATLRAEAMARKREKERLKKARTQQMEEMRLLFEQLLSTVFKKWTGKLWRIVNGSITKNEMLDAYKAILQSNSIQANDNMINKVGDLLTYLSMSPEVAESLRIVQNQQQAPGLTAGDETADKTSNVDLRATAKSRSKPTSASAASAGNETAGTPQSTNDDDASKETSPNGISEGTGVSQDDSGSNATPTTVEVQPKLFCLSPEYLSTDKWDQQTYVEATMILTDAGKWTIDDLSTFLLSLAAHIDTLGDKLISRFNSIYFAPKFSRTPGAVTFAPKDEWRHKLAKVVQEFDGKVPGGDSLKSSLIDYCRGNVTLAQLGVPQNLLNDVNGSEQTSLTIHPSTPERKLSGSKAVRKLKTNTKNGKGLTADTLNTSIDKVVTQMGNKMTSLVGGILSNLKYKGTKRENEKIPISPDNFTDRLMDHLQINNNEFSDLFKVLEIVFDSLSGAVNETQIAKVIETTVLTHNINRAEIQDQALKDVIALSRRDDMAIAEFSESALHILSRAIEQMHPEHRISGRVSLAESNVSKIQDSDNGEGEMLVERFLRIRDLLGEVYGTGEQGFEAKTMALAKPFQSNDAHEDPVHAVKLNDDRVAKYVGLPLIASSKKPVGVIGMTLVGKEDGGYVPPDVEFLQSGASKIIETIERIDSREKAVQIALASLQYMREKVGDTSDVHIYISQPPAPPPPEQTNDNIFRVLDRPYSPIGRDKSENDQEVKNALAFARYMAGASGQSNVEKLTDDAPEMADIQQSIKTKDVVHSTPTPADNGNVKTYVPVQDDDGKVVAVICMKPKHGKKGRVTDEDLNEVRKIKAILGNASSVSKKAKFGEQSELQHLAGESIDEESSRALLFPTMMLVAARSWLSKLDNRAISELKSYKKPPVAVLKVLKAVCIYSERNRRRLQSGPILSRFDSNLNKYKTNFGTQFVNMDLLKAMIAYDPTAIQKKIRFRRCNRVLHTLSKTDVKKKTSIPTMVMFDWLIVSLDLRRRAVEARQRHPLVFNESATETEAGESDTDAEGEDEGDVGTAGSGEAGILEGTEEGEEVPSVALE